MSGSQAGSGIKDSSLELINPELRRKIVETYRRSNERIAAEYLSGTESRYFLEAYIQ
jgi:hypothetical protein